MNLKPNMTRVRYQVKSAFAQLGSQISDVVRNRSCTNDEAKLLVVRHPAKHASMFRDFYRWVRLHVPELHSRMEFRHIPFKPKSFGPYGAVVFWINDTLDRWSPNGYRQACELLQACRDSGVACINPIDQIHNAGKLTGGDLMRTTGVRTPICKRVPNDWRLKPEQRDIEQFNLSFPVLLREQRGHGCPSLYLESQHDLRAADLNFTEPIVVEFIDTKSPADGRFRKYRYVVAGDVGVPRHLITDEQWDVRPFRRVDDANAHREEATVVSQSVAEHRKFQMAKRAIGMDVVGFDYSYTREGELVIWEANPFLDMNFPKHLRDNHLEFAVQRTFAAVARCYLRALGVAVPAMITDVLGDVATYDHPGPEASSVDGVLKTMGRAG